jgi:hypothetical protein
MTMKVLAAFASAMLLTLAIAGTASAAPTTVSLGGADPFAILAAAGVSDVPTSTINGNVGVSPGPGSSITGLTCAEVTGTIYAVDATGLPCFTVDPGLLTTAMSNLGTAYGDAAGRTPDDTSIATDNQLGGRTLVAGVYRFGHATTANLSGNLTLTGDADSVWIFQATSDLVTAASSTVTLTGGAQACNVFWQVGSSATLHTSSSLVGTVLADTSISVDASVTVAGRLLAGAVTGSGAVTLIQDTITRPASCVTQASINAAAAALAQSQAAAAAAAANAAAAAAAQAATDAANAATATAAKAARDAQAAKATALKAHAAKAKATAVAKAKAKAKAKKTGQATTTAIVRKRASVRPPRAHFGFTG